VELAGNNLPLTGVFTVIAKVKEIEFNGVASIGYNPTVKDTRIPSLEVHLLDFSEDIYGEAMQVSFIEKLRNEEKFANLDELKKQIALDIEQARTYFNNHAND
jgi:riboflavin kinase/FMN adenylyltransferase